MIAVYSEQHRQHHGRAELDEGRLVPCIEQPARAEAIVQALMRANLGPLVAPLAMPLDVLTRVHDQAYLTFLQTAAEQQRQTNGSALPYCWPRRRNQPPPRHPAGQLGYYAMDAGTPITGGTWDAALAAVAVTLTALRYVLSGAPGAFALCRPPGHHAGKDSYGGYCFLNNAALAAQTWLEAGARVAVLDLDYHHGNGTQEIFYHRDDVLVVSIHADPAEEYPFYGGYADERGEGPGRGYTRNLPLPLGTAWADYREALAEALELIAAFRADGLVVSLGLDTSADDPLGTFRLVRDDFAAMGGLLAQAGLPTVFVLEGGYHLPTLGGHTVAVLGAFTAQAGTS